jgi:hypothetical protein
MPDRSLNNMPWVHEGVLHSAFTYEYRIENSELGIKADHVEYFFRTSGHKRDRDIQQQLQRYLGACAFA